MSLGLEPVWPPRANALLKLGLETGFHLRSHFLTASRFPVFLTASKVLGSKIVLSYPVNTTERRGTLECVDFGRSARE